MYYVSHINIQLGPCLLLLFLLLLLLFQSENWIEVSVLVELRTVRVMTQGDSNLRPLWRDQQP